MSICGRIPQDLAADEQQPETVENAKEMWDALGRRCPAPMLELVMNHGSFAQTIENLFALSFLVRPHRLPQHDADVLHLLLLSFPHKKRAHGLLPTWPYFAR